MSVGIYHCEDGATAVIERSRGGREGFLIRDGAITDYLIDTKPEWLPVLDFTSMAAGHGSLGLSEIATKLRPVSIDGHAFSALPLNGQSLDEIKALPTMAHSTRLLGAVEKILNAGNTRPNFVKTVTAGLTYRGFGRS